MVFLLPVFLNLHAQDIHFSQFYGSPLTLNPALTGLFRQDVRAAVIYRNQWKQANSAFVTKAFAGDVNFIVGTKDKIGVGIFVMNDKVGDGIISNNTALISLAYHKVLDPANRHKVSVGMQTGYVQKSIDYSSLFFGSQISSYQYDPNLSSGEPLGRTNFGYLNLNLGGVYTFKLSNDIDFQSGVSFSNLVKPKESFVRSLAIPDINKLSHRFTWSGTMRYQLTSKVSLLPGFLFMRQSKAIDFNIGSAVGYSLNTDKSTIIRAGLWYRAADAVIISSGIRFKNYDLGLSYDFTSSKLNEIKKSPTVNDHARIGAFEVILTYYGFLKRPVPAEMTIPCRFF